MEKIALSLIIIAGIGFSSCVTSISGSSLDDLNDMEEYVGALVINGSLFKGQKVVKILINGVEHSPKESITFSESGFYRIEVFRKSSNTKNPDLLRIVILDEERGETEWGLNTWTPLPNTMGQIDERDVTLIYPTKYPQGVSVPLIVKTEGDMHPASPTLQATIGSLSFLIKRGIGSVQVAVDILSEMIVDIDHRSFPMEISPFDSPPLLLHGILAADTHIPSETFVFIGKDLTIPTGILMVIDSGAFISIGPGVNIYNEGRLLVNGSPQFPVTFTCSEANDHWGGFIGSGSENYLKATHTIFCQSGSHTGGIYDYGHAHRQALVYCESGTLEFDYCYMIDHAGQVFYPVGSTLDIKNSLVQRAITGGQVNDTELIMDNCVFTDFPDDSRIFQDQDNDALYLMGSNANISNCLFMYAKDDGLDSGGSGGGEIHVRNSVFYSVFHEGAALSSGGAVEKLHQFTNCTFENSGQGLELGYSSPNHLVIVDSCTFRNNGIGLRYGDNYKTPHRGKILVSNSKSIFNRAHDIWNMTRETWSADTCKMEFTNVLVSRGTPMYPQLQIYE